MTKSLNALRVCAKICFVLRKEVVVIQFRRTLKKMMGTVLLSAMTLTIGIQAVPALADGPALYVTAPQKTDVATLNLNRPVHKQDGVVFLPLRATLSAVGIGITTNPDGQSNQMMLGGATNAYVLYLQNSANSQQVGVTQNGPWYQMKKVGDSQYVPMAFFQSITNREVSVVGNTSLSFVDKTPTWAKTEQGYFNSNEFWKANLATYATPAAPVAKATVPAVLPANAASSVDGLAVIDCAKEEIGVPYLWGGMSSKGFDCSGLTSYVFAKNGKALPRTAAEQQAFANPIALNNLQTGDLVFWGEPAWHVGIYIGNGQFIHAPSPGQNVSICSVSEFPYSSAGRV